MGSHFETVTKAVNQAGFQIG